MTHRARDAASGAVLADRLRVANTHWTRLRGLLGTVTLDRGEGLWIVPCRQVHTVGMRYAIDVIFLDRDHRVVRQVSRLPRGSLSPRVPGAHSVLELPAGTLAELRLRDGAKIEIDGAPPAEGLRASAIAVAAGNLTLAALFLLFAVVHVRVALRTGRWLTTMPIVAQEAIMVPLFVGRRRSVATSDRPLDWVLGMVGTCLPLMLRPTRDLGPLGGLGAPLQIAGLSLVVAALLFLARSLGVIAADRGVKDGGPYAVIRHPMYAGYLLSYLGYVLSYPGLRNGVLAAVAIAALHARAVVEERFLCRNPIYHQYRRQVPWRFVPGVY